MQICFAKGDKISFEALLGFQTHVRMFAGYVMNCIFYDMFPKKSKEDVCNASYIVNRYFARINNLNRNFFPVPLVAAKLYLSVLRYIYSIFSYHLLLRNEITLHTKLECQYTLLLFQTKYEHISNIYFLLRL